MTPVSAFAILIGANQLRSETMRAVLFHAIQSQHPRDWLHFRQEAGVIVMQLKNVETLGENVWLIKQPDQQMSLDELAKVATRMEYLIGL